MTTDTQLQRARELWASAQEARGLTGIAQQTREGSLDGGSAMSAILAALSEQQAVPAEQGQRPVAIPGAPTCCKECGGTDLTWFDDKRIVSDLPQGRLNTRDVESVFVLGCDECSATLMVVKAHTIAAALNAAPQPAVPEGWALVPVEPTAGMLGAGLRHVHGLATMPAAWRAMLAAKPEAKG